MAILDTHKAIERIIHAGASKEMAEAIVESVNTRNDDVATKSDIFELRSEINELKVATKSDINALRSELKSDISELRTDIGWLKTISIANFGMILGAIVTLLLRNI